MNKSVLKPSDINRRYVHYGEIRVIKQGTMENTTLREIMSTGTAFIVSRDPYTRLWSAYIDKFFLPDFWGTEARIVLRLLRPEATIAEKNCPKSVTFVEFLTYIAKTYPADLQEHWQPVVKLCSPCHVNYDIILKQESLQNDTNALLDKIGLGKFKFSSKKGTQSRNMEEMKMITAYNFNLQSRYPGMCYELEDVANRLWRTFQYNGYIYRHFDIPLAEMMDANFTEKPLEVFMKYVNSTLQFQSLKELDLRHQKRSMMLEAYKEVPEKVLHAIRTVYQYDFQMFGYNMKLAV